MTLGELTAGIIEPGGTGAGEVKAVTADSRTVEPGSLFVALPRRPEAGFRHDGHDYIGEAVARGAVAVVASDRAKALPAAGDVPVILCDDPRAVLPRLAARFHGDASQRLRLVGVTGTNGKTTTTYLLDQMLRAVGWRTTLVGTVETRLGDEVRPAVTTTPDPVSLQELWREAADAGITGGCMEVSSHALDQHRVDGTRFEIAVFTNLSQDHLDYHRDLEDYFAAKARLFAPDAHGWAPRAVVNLDDPYGRRLLEGRLREPVTYGTAVGAIIRGSELRCDAKGATFRVTTPVQSWEQRIGLPGEYNVSNALAALAAAWALELDLATAAAALRLAGGAPGRLEAVDCGQPFSVLVDYAHTPDALDNVLRAARGFCAGRLICVFGCGGDRDRTKRPRMGRIAAELADLVVVTSDNPRTERPEAILSDILSDIDGGAGLIVEVDRRVAIGLAIERAEPGDVVLIAGKGHEDYQIIGTTKHPFDDRQVAREWLEQRG